MSAKPTRPTRPTPATRLSVERLDARVVPAIVNPVAGALPAVKVGTPLSADQTLATFDSPSAAAGLTATVAVNGGSALTGVVVATGPGSDGVPEYAVRLAAGAFTPTVAGTGALTFVVNVADAADGTTAKVSGKADVLANPLSVVSVGTDIAPAEGVSGTFPLATFRTTEAGAKAGDFTASVDWGDGSQASAGTVVALGDGKFRVDGTHAYGAPDKYDVTVSVTDADGDKLVARTATAPIADAAVAVTVPPLAATAGVAMTDVRVATFTDANPLAAAADYTATVNWGDGTTTAATVVADGAGFAVVGGHTYSAAPVGSAVTVTVRNKDTAAPYTGSGSLTVAPNYPPPLSEPQQFVQGLYLRELNRAGTTAELDGWVGVMGGANGRTNVANAISRSTEARTRQVSGWYQTYLGRSAQGGEERGWVQQLLQGGTEEQVQGGILGSQEFANRAQTLVSSGTPAERQVQVMYSTLLGRYASVAETGDWVTVMSQKGSGAVAGGLLNSIEYRTRVFENYYLTILGRPADAAGLHGWVYSGLETVTVRAAISAVSTGPAYYPMPV